MKDRHPRSEESIFSAALEFAPEERGVFLDKECAGEPDLRRRVEELIQAQPRLGEFMEKQPELETLVTGRSMLSPDEGPGSRIGRYKLLQKIGEGGCGVVYMAEQDELVKRRVALKIIKLGMDTRNVIARFNAERQALAMMEHPNIARILDAGATETGRPYFVMELVRGARITDFCDQSRLPTRDRLNLFIQVCQAVQHAHQKGVIHRDLKPSNILVTVHGPGSPGVPVIIDFGIAKATEGRLNDQTFFTAFEQFIGTPAYMSPEQAMMTSLDIDTRSDIYSLGVLLYELLTGRTPFDTKELLAAGFEAMRRTIGEKEPMRPSTRLSALLATEQTTAASLRQTEPPKLIHLVRGDMDWIVMKCLEKDRALRYETADSLAADIQRHLNHETVLARPASTAYRLRKLVYRNKLACGSAVAVTGALLLGMVVSVWQAVRATQAREATIIAQKQAEQAQAREQHQRQLAETRLYAADIYSAQREFENGNLGRARELLKAHLPEPGREDLRAFEWRYLWQICKGDNLYAFAGHSNAVRCLAYSPDSLMLASAGAESTVRLWDVKGRRLLAVLPVHENAVHSLAFSNDGELLATVGDNGVKLWNIQSRQLTRSFNTQGAARIVFCPVGRRLAIGYGHPVFADPAGGPMKIWDYGANQVVQTFAEPGSRLAFSPDGKILAANSDNRAVKLWNVATGEEMRKLENTGEVYSLTFSPDGQTLAAVNKSGSALWWNVATGEPGPAFKGHTGVGWSLAFSPDSRSLATAGTDCLRLWNMATGEAIKLTGHDSEVKVVAFAPDGQTLATGGKDAMVMLWNTAPRPLDTLVTNVNSPPSFSSDSKLLATVKSRGPITVWNKESRQATWSLSGERRAEFFNSGNILATISSNFALRFWDVETRTLLRSVPLAGVTDSTQRFHFALSGEYLAAARRDGASILLHNTATGEEIGKISGPFKKFVSLAFSPDARLLAASIEDHPLKVWEVATQKELAIEISQNRGSQGLAFSPDGSVLASASWDETVAFLDVATGRAGLPLTGIKGGCAGVAFSPDGKTLAAGCEDGVVRLWNLATRREVAFLRHGNFPVHNVTFSPDGQTLVGISWDTGTMRFWDAPRPPELHSLGTNMSVFK